jgi:hypothetical protein
MRNTQRETTKGRSWATRPGSGWEDLTKLVIAYGPSLQQLPSGDGPEALQQTL